MEAVVFCGIQGAGKTSFYRERFLDTHVRISGDMLRTRHRERLLLRACLEGGIPFVVDKMNQTAAHRAPWVAAARAAEFTVSGYFFDAPVADAIARNARREGRALIPVPALVGARKQLEPPRREEGFDRLFLVRVGDGTFAVEERDAF